MEQIYAGYNNTFIEYGEIKSETVRVDQQQPHEFEIGLYFKLETISYSYIVNVDSGEAELASRPFIYPTAEFSVILKLDELLDHEKVLDVIEEQLSDAFSIRGDFLREWADSALKKATEVVGSMPVEHNVALIVSPARFNYECIYDPRLEEAAAQEDDENNYMVPAAEAWIDQVLVKRTLTVTEYSDDDGGFGTCAVCLEDFNGGEVVLSMPCEHYFHGDCIGEWLRTSHYCPVCRFEGPTMMMN